MNGYQLPLNATLPLTKTTSMAKTSTLTCNDFVIEEEDNSLFLFEQNRMLNFTLYWNLRISDTKLKGICTQIEAS